MNLTLETRVPNPLASAGYHELAKVFPAIDAARLFVDATKAAESIGRTLPHLAMNGAAHWVPSDVFARLNGASIHGGATKVYPTDAEALADLARVWQEVRGTP